MAYEKLDLHVCPGIIDNTSFIGFNDNVDPYTSTALHNFLETQGYQVTPISAAELPEVFFPDSKKYFETQPPLSKAHVQQLREQGLESADIDHQAVWVFDYRDCFTALTTRAQTITQRQPKETVCVEL